MGSKTRIASEILPLMLSAAHRRGLDVWVEPFVGGGNLIDKVPDHFKRFGFDLNPHTVQALIGVRDYLESLPASVSEADYKAVRGTAPHPVTSLIRYGAAFGGKFESGYARSFARNGQPRDHWAECIRNARLQSPALQGVHLEQASYEDLIGLKNCVIYCDPPYLGVSGYKTGAFDHARFWQFARIMSRENLVFVSEYTAPEDFVPIWSGTIKTGFNSQRKAAFNAVEKLFIYNEINL